jgi:hypothetical protein
MSKPTVFISYSHRDEEWKDRLVTHLGVLRHQGLLDLWDDRRIGAGQDWKQEIKQAMDAASVAVLLVSAHFLTSRFILGEEVTRLLERRAPGSLDRARADLEEALSIATRGGMRLHKADCHLEYARLHLACGEREKARQSLAQAKEMIEDMGYHRRDGEVAELEEMLRP